MNQGTGKEVMFGYSTVFQVEKYFFIAADNHLFLQQEYHSTLDLWLPHKGFGLL